MNMSPGPMTWPQFILDEGLGLPKAKRRKVETACELCRVRKTRCDGVRPKCGRCKERKDTSNVCIYLEAPQRKQVINDSGAARPSTGAYVELDMEEISPMHIELPRTREKRLRSSVDEHNALSRNSMRAPSAPSVSSFASSSHNPGRPSMGHPGQRLDTKDSYDNEDAIDQPEDWIVNAGLLGASGSASIVRSIYKATDRNGSPRSDIPSPSIAPDQTSNRPVKTKQLGSGSTHSAEYVLPSRKVADKLLDVHWSCSHVPWVDRLRLMSWYDRLWTGREVESDEVDEQIYHLILNTIFALSYKADTTLRPEDQERLSEEFFGRAQKLMTFNLLDLNHIGLVQGLLLMSQYFQSANMTRQCFESVGLAITVAQNLGLHLPQRLASIRSQHDREMARRAWHCCILMDRITSMTFGRPMRVSQDVARRSPLPTAIDDEHLEDGDVDGMQPPDRPSKVTFFLAFCKLHIILGDILSTLYHERLPSGTHINLVESNSSVETQYDTLKIMEFDQALSIWRENLEVHLQIMPDGTAADPDFCGQAVNLFARFLHIRVLLFRVFFSRLPTKTDFRAAADYPDLSHEPPQFAETVTRYGLVTCVKAAQQILELLSSNSIHNGSPGVAPPWYIVISNVYTAATLVIAARLIPNVVEQISLAGLTRSTTQSLELLEQYGSSQKPAQRCKAALVVLYDKILAIENSPDGSPTRQPSSPGGGSNGNSGIDNITLASGLHWDTNLPETFFDGEFRWHFDTASFDTDNYSWL